MNEENWNDKLYEDWNVVDKDETKLDIIWYDMN